MGWETRGGNRYYYRKRRIGGRVVSEYVGGGLIGQLSAQTDAAAAARRHEAAALVDPEAEAVADILRDFVAFTDALVSAHLLVRGYRKHHRGEWRKQRGETG